VPAESAPLEDYSDSATYRWVIRGLYVTAIGLNIWILWKASADDVELAILRNKARGLWAQVTRPATEAKIWRRSLNRMHFEVAETLEHGAAPTLGDPDA
jgi:hypothetical protein